MSQEYIRLARSDYDVCIWGTRDDEIRKIIDFSKNLFPSAKIENPIKNSPQYYRITKIDKVGESLFLEIFRFLCNEKWEIFSVTNMGGVGYGVRYAQEFGLMEAYHFHKEILEQ